MKRFLLLTFVAVFLTPELCLCSDANPYGEGSEDLASLKRNPDALVRALESGDTHFYIDRGREYYAYYMLEDGKSLGTAPGIYPARAHRNSFKIGTDVYYNPVTTLAGNVYLYPGEQVINFKGYEFNVNEEVIDFLEGIPSCGTKSIFSIPAIRAAAKSSDRRIASEDGYRWIVSNIWKIVNDGEVNNAQVFPFERFNQISHHHYRAFHVDIPPSEYSPEKETRREIIPDHAFKHEEDLEIARAYPLFNFVNYDFPKQLDLTYAQHDVKARQMFHYPVRDGAQDVIIAGTNSDGLVMATYKIRLLPDQEGNRELLYKSLHNEDYKCQTESTPALVRPPQRVLEASVVPSVGGRVELIDTTPKEVFIK